MLGKQRLQLWRMERRGKGVPVGRPAGITEHGISNQPPKQGCGQVGGKLSIYGNAHETDVPQDAKMKKQDEPERNDLSLQGLRTKMKGMVLRGEGGLWRCPAFQVDVLRAVQQ